LTPHCRYLAMCSKSRIDARGESTFPTVSNKWKARCEVTKLRALLRVGSNCCADSFIVSQHLLSRHFETSTSSRSEFLLLHCCTAPSPFLYPFLASSLDQYIRKLPGKVSRALWISCSIPNSFSHAYNLSGVCADTHLPVSFIVEPCLPLTLVG
jgi:hypothetical protein